MADAPNYSTPVRADAITPPPFGNEPVADTAKATLTLVDAKGLDAMRKNKEISDAQYKKLQEEAQKLPKDKPVVFALELHGDKKELRIAELGTVSDDGKKFTAKTSVSSLNQGTAKATDLTKVKLPVEMNLQADGKPSPAEAWNLMEEERRARAALDGRKRTEQPLRDQRYSTPQSADAGAPPPFGNEKIDPNSKSSLTLVDAKGLDEMHKKGAIGDAQYNKLTAEAQKLPKDKPVVFALELHGDKKELRIAELGTISDDGKTFTTQKSVANLQDAKNAKVNDLKKPVEIKLQADGRPSPAEAWNLMEKERQARAELQGRDRKANDLKGEQPKKEKPPYDVSADNVPVALSDSKAGGVTSANRDNETAATQAVARGTEQVAAQPPVPAREADKSAMVAAATTPAGSAQSTSRTL